jgi:hypothetical protein
MRVVPQVAAPIGSIVKLTPTNLNDANGFVVTVPATANAILFSCDGGIVRYTIDGTTTPVHGADASEHVGWLIREEDEVTGPYVVYLPPGGRIRFKRAAAATGAYVQYQFARFTVA